MNNMLLEDGSCMHEGLYVFYICVYMCTDIERVRGSDVLSMGRIIASAGACATNAKSYDVSKRKRAVLGMSAVKLTALTLLLVTHWDACWKRPYPFCFAQAATSEIDGPLVVSATKLWKRGQGRLTRKA